jgi:hypothetical protein
MSASASLWHHIEFLQIGVAALFFHHKEVTGDVVSEGPSHQLFALLRDQEDAVPFGIAMLQFPPMLDDIGCVAAAIRLESGLIVLQARDEGQDRRFVSGQTCLTDTNGRAP